MGKDWSGAAHLVGRMLVWMGLVLVAVGITKTSMLYLQSQRGLETLATIDSTANRSLGTGGWVDRDICRVIGGPVHPTIPDRTLSRVICGGRMDWAGS